MDASNVTQNESLQYSMGRILVDEVLKPTVNYKTLFADLVPDLINLNGLIGIFLSVKLALAMVITGSMELHYFMLAFKLVSEFELLGDCYWVIQLEFLRHSALERIRQGFSPEGLFQVNKVCTALYDVFPFDGNTILPVISRCSVLGKNTVLLRNEINHLVVTIEQATYPQKILDRYSEKFPLKSFVDWFLTWAKSFLLLTETSLNSKYRIYCPSKQFVKTNMITRELFRTDQLMSQIGLNVLMCEISDPAFDEQTSLTDNKSIKKIKQEIKLENVK